MSLQQARGGYQAFEATLRKLGSNGGTMVSKDDVTIALSRVNAAITLDDVREFFSSICGESPGQADGQGYGVAGSDQQV